MFIAERFLSDPIKTHGRHPVSTDAERSRYPMACKFLKLKHHLHSSFERSIIERTMHYIKNRTEYVDDYFLCCTMNKCKLKHVQNWLNIFVNYHNNELNR